MIITKTPFRVSFAGGGTDISDFYTREEGAVVSTAIDKYIYIALHKYFENKILLKYSKTEEVDSVDQIEHPLIKQCFLKSGNPNYLEVTSFADIPSKGSGLGSSSAFNVGLLRALYTQQGVNVGNKTLARQACEIEIDELKSPIGKQDQYACAIGGLNLIRFTPEGDVLVEPIKTSQKVRNQLNNNLLMFYTGITRKADSILSEQKKEMSKEDKFQKMVQMRNMAYELSDVIKSGDISSFGDILHRGWMLKKELAGNISSGVIDGYYDKAMMLGASGGKILGAGGGGFLLFYCEPEHQDNLRTNLGLRELKFKLEPQGSTTIFMEDDYDE